MKQKFTLLICFFSCIAFSALAQKDTKRNYSSFFDRGNKIVGIELGIAGDYPIRSVTQLNISKGDKNYGLLVLPSYGWFVENNWVVGGQAILGFSNNSYTYQYTNSGGSIITSEDKSRYSDFGVAPFTRYFIPLGKRNVVSIFAQASVPVIYSTSKKESTRNGNFPYFSAYSDEEFRLFGTIGLGVALNGRFGSLEANANNTGLYIGFHKYISKK